MTWNRPGYKIYLHISPRVLIFLCYTQTMQADRALWPNWANFLQRWGLRDLAVLFLDSAGPFSILGAQFIYASQPFLHQAFPQRNLTALAALFENQSEMKLFAAFLREDSTP